MARASRGLSGFPHNTAIGNKLTLVQVPSCRTDEPPTRIAAELDRIGVVCLDDVVSADWLAAAQTAATSLIAAHNGRHVTVYSAAEHGFEPARQMLTDERLQRLLTELMLIGCPGGGADGERIHTVLRINSGVAPHDDPLWFHYDASAITLVIPVFMPEGARGESGELVVFPNRRPFRRFVGANIAEKLLTQNSLYRKRIENQLALDRDAHILALKPGNAYLFWGYRTYHAYARIPPSEVRATLCLHYGRPHGRHPALAAALLARDLLRKAFLVFSFPCYR